MKTILISLFIIIMSYFQTNSQTTLFLTVNGVTKTATLIENDATASLVSLLQKGSVTLSFSEYGGFEKIADLPSSLPTNDRRQTAQPGDIMLYLGNVMCIFLGSNTWSYTKLGKLDNMVSSEIKEFMSGTPTKVTLSLTQQNTETE